MKSRISLILTCVLILASYQAQAKIIMTPMKNRLLLSGENHGKYTTSASNDEGTSGGQNINNHVYTCAEKPPRCK